MTTQPRRFKHGEEIMVAVTPDSLTLDPENDFEAVMIAMVQKHREKSADYSGDEHPNQNFYDSARQLAQTGGHSVEQLIAIKQARLRILLPRFWRDKPGPMNERIEDTLLDRAVYSVIAVTIWEEGGYGYDE